MIQSNEREVYENMYTKELTFDYDPESCVVVGTTDGTLEDFRNWAELQYKNYLEKLK